MHVSIPNPQIDIIKDQILSKTSKDRWRREEEEKEGEQGWKRMEKRRKRLSKAIQCRHRLPVQHCLDRCRCQSLN